MKAKKQKLLDWIRRSAPVLESQIVGSGMNAALNELIRDRAVMIVPHPTVVERGSGIVPPAPAAAVVLYDDMDGFEERTTQDAGKGIEIVGAKPPGAPST